MTPNAHVAPPVRGCMRRVGLRSSRGQPWLGLERWTWKGRYMSLRIWVWDTWFHILLDRIQHLFVIWPGSDHLGYWWKRPLPVHTGSGALCSSYLIEVPARAVIQGVAASFEALCPLQLKRLCLRFRMTFRHRGQPNCHGTRFQNSFQGWPCNVQEYVHRSWSSSQLCGHMNLDQLAPRAALLIQGTAFKKIARTPPAKLKIKTTDGIAALVEAIVGSWGSTEWYRGKVWVFREIALRAKRADESHDSLCQGWRPVFWSSSLEMPR